MIDLSKLITVADKLELARMAKLAHVNQQAQAAVDQYVSGYPRFEIETWPTQKTEALAWQENSAADTPWCDAAAAQRGMSREAFLAKVLAKVQAFTMISAHVAGYRQGLEDQIDAANSIGQIDAIVWSLPAL